MNKYTQKYKISERLAQEQFAEQYAKRQKCIDYISDLADRLGYTPTCADIPLDDLSRIKNHYTAVPHVIKEAGLESASFESQRQLREKILNERLHDLAAVYGESPENVDREEYEFLCKEYMFTKKITPTGFKPLEKTSSYEEIERYLRAFGDEFGFSPTTKMTSGAKQVIKKYGTWYKALEAVGLERTDTLNQVALREKVLDKRFRKLLKLIFQQDSGTTDG